MLERCRDVRESAPGWGDGAEMHTARYLEAEGFGVLSSALAFTGTPGVFADPGLRQLTVRGGSEG
ncbi:MAG: hypothetical protein U9N12_01305 [Euryarchaeota archaeon]|nr:hypothetical protein [Euryarchaeota archaeon]